MKKPRYRLAVISMVAVLPLIVATAHAQGKKEGTGPKTLVLGLVFQGSQEPVEKRFRPFVDYVAGKISAAGATKGMVVVAPTAGHMMKLLHAKRVDFYMESVHPTYLINRLGAARLLLRRWKGGMAEYHSILFTGRGSGIARLDDLREKFIAFEDPGSTSGYFLPKLYLHKKGFSVVEKPSLESKLSSGEIGYIFAGTETKVVDFVTRAKVAAGAISNDDYGNMDDKNKALTSILGETEPVPRHLVSVRQDLPEPAVRRLRDILVKMHQEEEANKILRQTDNTTKFDELPGGEAMMRRKLVELYRDRRNK